LEIAQPKSLLDHKKGIPSQRVFLQIENCTLMTAEVRKTCADFKEKITASRDSMI